MKASIIILTKNGLPLVEACLTLVWTQETAWSYQVLVVDSGSTDGTLEIASSYPVKILRISSESFNHGSTRNLAAQNCRGDFLVFLVQDAIPADEHWLQNLVEACERPDVAGSYSKQLVRPESSPITRFLATGSTPCAEEREIKRLPVAGHLHELPPAEQFNISLFQNASSCIKRSVWEKYPFAAIPYGEDIEWGKRVIEAGFSLVYEPTSAVYHSHDRSPLYALKRAYADHFLVKELFGLVIVPSLWAALRTWGWRTREAWKRVGSMPIHDKLRYGFLVPFFTSAVTAGEYLGANSGRWLSKCSLLLTFDRWMRRGV